MSSLCSLRSFLLSVYVCCSTKIIVRYFSLYFSQSTGVPEMTERGAQLQGLILCFPSLAFLFLSHGAFLFWLSRGSLKRLFAKLELILHKCQSVTPSPFSFNQQFNNNKKIHAGSIQTLTGNRLVSVFLKLPSIFLRIHRNGRKVHQQLGL